eukprot:m.291212 g.291212  ORF g.291212 m.291212 type:complete len:311 (-) comp12439_c0_seq1:2971-3903(-)
MLLWMKVLGKNQASRRLTGTGGGEARADRVKCALQQPTQSHILVALSTRPYIGGGGGRSSRSIWLSSGGGGGAKLGACEMDLVRTSPLRGPSSSSALSPPALGSVGGALNSLSALAVGGGGKSGTLGELAAASWAMALRFLFAAETLLRFSSSNPVDRSFSSSGGGGGGSESSSSTAAAAASGELGAGIGGAGAVGFAGTLAGAGGTGAASVAAWALAVASASALALAAATCSAAAAAAAASASAFALAAASASALALAAAAAASVSCRALSAASFSSSHNSTYEDATKPERPSSSAVHQVASSCSVTMR